MKYLAIFIIFFGISLVSADVTYEMIWDERDIVNGEDFKIKVIVDGADDELYDGKLWIEDRSKIISDRYDIKRDDWRSSYYYINEFFEDGENEVGLRIDEEYRDFEGEAYIHFRVRGEEEIKEEIDILNEKDKNDLVESSEENKEISSNEDDKNISADIQDNNMGEDFREVILEPISLGSKVDSLEEKDINSDNVVYQSKGFKIIEYSVYGFAVLCVLLCVLVIWRKLD